jgi:hypothetical protein
MTLGLRMPDKDTRLTIGFAVLGLPVVVSYLLTVWTLVGYVAALGQMVVDGLASLAG